MGWGLAVRIALPMSSKVDSTKPYRCPNCERALYDRTAKRCGYCGAEIPAALQFSPEEMRAIEAQREKWKAASSHALSFKKPERSTDGPPPDFFPGSSGL